MSDKSTDPDFVYRGDDDGLHAFIRNFTSRDGDGSGEFEAQFHAAVKLLAAAKTGGRFLDVGCGLGRILDIVMPFAGAIVAIEPDPDRFRACEAGIRDPRLTLIQQTMQGFRSGVGQDRFDLIIASMVIQHVSTRTCGQILSAISDLLSPTGIAIVATTLFYEERFTYESDPSPHDVDEFDRYAENSASQPAGIPVRMFSKEAFLAEITASGLDLIDWQQFSYVRPENVDEVAGIFAAPGDRMRDIGISQYAVVRSPRAHPEATGSRPRAGLVRNLWWRRKRGPVLKSSGSGSA